MVGGDHTRHSTTRGKAVPITGVADGSPRNYSTETILAHAAITKKSPSGTKSTIVVKRLHDRHRQSRARMVRGWRDKRKCIMKMSYIRSLIPNKCFQFTTTIGCPNCSSKQACLVSNTLHRDLTIVALVQNDLMPCGCEQVALTLKDCILPSALLTRVVNQQYLHFLFRKH
jgi:hypothetical protein